VDGGAEIDGEHFVPEVVGGLFNAEATEEAADEMDDGVDAAVEENDVFDELVDGVEVFEGDGDVGEGGVVGALRTRDAVDADDFGAGGEECFGDSGAETAAGPGDENDFAFQVERVHIEKFLG
jgi:hypothetical protein